MSNLDDLALAIAQGLRRDQPVFCRQILRLLAAGSPVSVEQLTTTLCLSRDEVQSRLGELLDLEWNAQGHIVGWGLTLIPTPHRFWMNGYEMFTWCALDALMYPVILEQTAYVQSACPVTGKTVCLVVTPESMESLTPPNAVVSIVLPTRGEAFHCVREAFCKHGHFFSSSEAAGRWLSEHQGSMLLSAGEAYQLGRLVHRYTQ